MPGKTAARPLPSADELNRMFRYDPLSGVLYRRDNSAMSKNWRVRFAEKPTGCANKRGYLQVGIGRVLYLAHRIIWKMVYGEEPPEIDHRDGNPSNNSKKNLRRATHAQNMGNSSKRQGKDLPIGVFRSPAGNFYVRVGNEHIGTFRSVADATAAYAENATRIYGQFSCVVSRMKNAA